MVKKFKNFPEGLAMLLSQMENFEIVPFWTY